MYPTRCCQFTLGSTLMPSKKSWSQPEVRERELALKRMKENQRKREYKKKVRDKEKARDAALNKHIERYVNKIVNKYAYDGRNEVSRRMETYMKEMGLKLSDVTSVVNWHQLYDMWWESFHLGAGHTTTTPLNSRA